MNKGLTLYLAVIIMSILLALVLGLIAVSVTQLKTIRGVENSVVAFYAADAGAERVLKEVFSAVSPGGDESGLLPCYCTDCSDCTDCSNCSDTDDLTNGASYRAELVCCDSSVPECNFFDPLETCPVTQDINCSSFRYCIRSKGTYRGAQRAIEATYGVQLAP